MTAPQIMVHSGHKSLKVVQRYIHLTNEDVRDKVLHSLSLDEETGKPSLPEKDRDKEPCLKLPRQQGETDSYIAKLEEKVKKLEKRLFEQEYNRIYV